VKLQLSQHGLHGPTFFSTLARLTSLQVLNFDTYCCNDWSLQQFATHGLNLDV
jgi:hypothetical protein